MGRFTYEHIHLPSPYPLPRGHAVVWGSPPLPTGHSEMITEGQLLGGGALAASATIPGFVSAKAAAPSRPGIVAAKDIAEAGLAAQGRAKNRRVGATWQLRTQVAVIF